ncbi:uncharacterized protein A4U43_C01F14300 [Asparagus officinalis]|uniref:histidine--tRNA ligase n=1 Tax=Asparagus officinalis TaxID=4686 RepID=A0A5P1FT06_ASPOF|nr:uncharacterized protein A4U43_C01F14300 [Asparagus officinalis]
MASSVVTVGGKGSTLSPLSVYSISNALSRVKIDSSALDKLSSQSKKPSSISPPPKTLPPTNPNFLTTEESRAALIVLLNKLILSDSDIRPVLPTLIEETLNLDHGHETLDFSSTFQLLDSLCRLNGKRLDEIGVTSDEIGVIEGSFAASTGICAILDCCASALVRLSDAVAALSCEAGRVDVKVFNLPVSGDGFSIKDETNVAGDMKVLLAESKLADKVDSVLFAEIPTLNASFREAVRSLHSRVRVELNSVVKAKKTVGVGSKGKEKAFVASVLPLAMAIQSMSECSLGRARLAIESLSDQELKARVLENFEKRSPNIDKLKESFQVITEKASSGSDYVKGLHSVYDTLINFREILAWEAVVALFVLDTDESIEKVQVGPSASILESGENSKGEKKSEKKKKKKKTLGKGTSLIRQLLKDRFMGKNEASIEDVAVLVEWVKELLLYFDPKDSGLDSLLNKVKEIVENNDSRRLPKIPKVDEKGLTVEIAERIGMFVKKRGSPLELLSELRSKDSQLLDNAGSVIALNELEILFKALEKSRCIDKVVFDLSLARGLDYYTGVIFEAVFKGSTQVGSIAAGGRYDNLVGMFSGKQVPAVGVSLGIERVFAIMEQLENDKHEATRATETQVLVAILSKDLALAAELVSELWDAKIKAEFGLTKRVMNHINRAKQAGIPWMVIVGESEISSGIVKLKNIEVNQEDSVPREEMVNELKRRLNI